MGMSFCHTDGGTRAYRAILSGPFTALLQTQFKPIYLGRVFSLFDSISLFPSIIGLLVTSFVADSLGIGNIFIYCGLPLC